MYKMKIMNEAVPAIVTSAADERRITLRLLSYWEKKRGARKMCAESDIDPADIADLWEYCFIAQVRDLKKSGYNFSYLGRAIADMYDDGMSGGDRRFPTVGILAKGHEDVVEKGEPVVWEGELTNPQGDMFKFRQVLLPLGEGASVKAVFGGMRFLRITNYN